MPKDETGPPAGSVLTLATQGNLVASTVDAHRKAAMEALAGPCAEVVLDLAASEVVDSLGITYLLGLYKTCQQRRIPFRVVRANPDLMRVFRLFNLQKIFSIEEA